MCVCVFAFDPYGSGSDSDGGVNGILVSMGICLEIATIVMVDRSACFVS